MTTNEPDRLLEPSQVAAILGISVGTLHKFGRNGEGPDFVLVGKQRRYPVKALHRFIGMADDDEETA